MAVFLHGSSREFSEFSLADAGRLDHASNGALGIWMTTEHWIASRFGDEGYVYSVEVPDGPVYEMSITMLREMHETARDLEDPYTYYDEFRRGLIDRGFTRIDVMELDFTAPTCVCLDPSFAKIIEVERICAVTPTSGITPD